MPWFREGWGDSVLEPVCREKPTTAARVRNVAAIVPGLFMSELQAHANFKHTDSTCYNKSGQPDCYVK